MRVALLCFLVAAGCDPNHAGQVCTLDSQCPAPLMCSAAVPPVGGLPVEGTCRRPAEQGGLCYRDADCVPGLACAFPDGPAAFSEGNCEPVGFDASIEVDAGDRDGSLQ